MSWSRGKTLGGSLLVGAISGAATYYYCALNEGFKPKGRLVHNSYTTNFEPSACAKWDKNWDHRDPFSLVKPLKKHHDLNEENVFNEKLEKVKPKAIRHLILIRHGQYNMEGASDAQRILTEIGRKQAEFTGARLKSLKINFNKMTRSTLSRAQETGKIISESLPEVPVDLDDLLVEGAPIPPEPPVGHWRPEKSFFQDGARIEAAYRKYFHRADVSQEKDSYELIVCHANVIRYFLCRVLQFPAEGWLRLSLNHSSISWVSILPSGRCIVRSIGDSGHIIPELITSR